MGKQKKRVRGGGRMRKDGERRGKDEERGDIDYGG
jgi:hypothetical protein